MSSSTEGKWLCLPHSETSNTRLWHGTAPNFFAELLYKLIRQPSSFLPTLNTTKTVRCLEITSCCEHLQLIAQWIEPFLSLAKATPFQHSLVKPTQSSNLQSRCDSFHGRGFHNGKNATPTKSPTQSQIGNHWRSASSFPRVEIGERLQNCL